MLVTTSPFVKTYTLDEFWQLPDPADRSKLELIRGVLYMVPPPDEKTHGPVVVNLMDLFVTELHRLGRPGRLFSPREGLWTFYPDTWLEPDLFYLSNESIARFKDRPRTSADIVIEVLSPATANYDRRTKADTYAALEVKELWLVDPYSKTVEVRQNADRQWGTVRVYHENEAVVSTVLIDLRIDIAAIFADL